MENYYKKVAKTYCDVYTHDDIKSLLKFYKTDLGQSLLKGQSEIMKKTMAMAQSLSNQIMPVVQKYSK